MRRGARITLVAVLLGIAGCGGGGAEPVGGGEEGYRMLTILEPLHGSSVPERVTLRLADTGVGPRPAVEVGVYVNGQLVATTQDRELELELEDGQADVRVEGIGPEGLPSAQVIGDRILLMVGGLDPTDPYRPELVRPRRPALP